MKIDLWALDRYEQIDPITTFSAVEIIERDLAEGGWQIDLPLGDAGDVGAKLLAADWPGIEVVDRDTGWRFGGYLVDYTVIVDEDGVESLRLIGADFQSDLAGWLEWPVFSTPDEWYANTYGGTIPATSDAHNTVLFNAGSGAAPGRTQIDGLIMGANPNAGPAKTRRLKGEPLMAVMRFLFADSADYTARLRLVRDINDGSGAVQFDTPARTVSPLTLDAKRGTFGRFEHTTSAAKATWVLAMGAEDPGGPSGARFVSITSTTETTWRTRHREQFINRPATDDTDALGDEVLAVLTDPQVKRRQSAKVASARVEGFGLDLDIGWMVPVLLGSTFTPSTVQLPVVASTLRFSEAEGWVRTVDLGVETLTGPASLQASIARTRAQIRQVENDIR